MGASTPAGRQDRAYTGLAQSFGPPIAGASQSKTLSALDQTIALTGPALYRIVATQPAFIGSADATVAANQEYLQPNWDRFIQVTAAGFTLHVVQAGTAGAIYVAKLDDVG